MHKTIIKLINDYYTAFNEKNMPHFFQLMADDIVHDINQGHQEMGKETFRTFMQRMNHCYNEHISHLEIMVNEAATRAAAEFVVNGTYINTDAGLPEAHGQKYSLPCGAFFDIRDGKVARVTNYYNLQDWLQQVRK